MEAYPKILNVTHVQLKELLKGHITVEEKVDGSQFSFQVTLESSSNPNHKWVASLKCRSRGRELYQPIEDKLFKPAVDYINSIIYELKPNWIYRGEVLCRPKHNCIAYGRVPRHNVVIFDIERGEQDFLTYEEKVAEASRIDLEVAPLLWDGSVDLLGDTLMSYLKTLLQYKSFLCDKDITPTVEGIVIKNYSHFGLDSKVLMGKWVNEEFKESNHKEWKNKNPNRGDVIEKLIKIYRYENRWEKAIQHLKESGKLKNDPSDIGQLIKEVQSDIMVEEREAIQQALFDWGWKQISRGIVRGLPEWYKEKLAEEQFNESGN